MKPASLLESNPSEIVLDTSAIVNLNATGYAKTILSSLSHQVLVPYPVITELKRGRAKGHDDAHDMFSLLKVGAALPVRMDQQERSTFIKLVGGHTSVSLGDGEAATLSLSENGKRWACIDEKKARRISNQSSSNRLISTLDLLLTDEVERALTKLELENAILNALEVSLMNVQPNHIAWIVSIIPKDRLKKCVSLPSRYRV